jgi:glycerol-3-phosphate acyltransferase PlsY
MLINPLITGIVVIITGYLLGSVPSAFIITRVKKNTDIRKLGGGNMGATNVMHQVGIWSAIIVAILDVGKGVAVILIGKALGASEIWLLAAGFCAIIGHCFPVYIGFRGGRGVATAIGVFLTLSPVATAIALAIICLVLFLSRNIFFSVVVCFPFFLISLWFVEKSPALMVLAAVVIIFMGIKSGLAFKETMSTMFRKFWRKNDS